MKKIFLALLITITLLSCKNDISKNYVTLSGKISNKNADTLNIINLENKKIKSIIIAKDGSFNDTLIVSKGKFYLSLDKEYAPLFIRNGDDIQISLDTKEFDETLSFSGTGSKENNYMIKKLLLQEEVFDNINDLYSLSKDDFTKALERTKTKFFNFLKEQKDLDPDFVQMDIDDSENLFTYLDKRYEKVQKLNELIGSPSPIFLNYENHDGSTTSLTDLKGKYVYIDVWATWCSPCIKEIPALKELEKEFGDQMYFVSISIDKADKYEIWKQMVTDKELKGVQLYADNNWDSQFVKDYGIDGIPRFILIDPIGNVVKTDASRPSNPKTKELLSNLLN